MQPFSTARRANIVAATTTALPSTRPLIKRPSTAKYKTLLTVDGGGIRGIVPIMVLQRLETEIKEHIVRERDELVPENLRGAIKSAADFDVDLTDYFDLVAGTSIGSFLAAYIATRGKGVAGALDNPEFKQISDEARVGSMALLSQTFGIYGKIVFPAPRIPFLGQVKALFSASAYSGDGVRRLAQDSFGELSMNDMETGCLITAYDTERSTACSFLRSPGSSAQNYTVRTAVRETARQDSSSFNGSFNGNSNARSDDWIPDLDVKKDTNYRVRDITVASSAMPMLLPPASISEIGSDKETVMVDGGVVALNPTLQALTYLPSAMNVGIEDVAIFSVGCGAADPSAGFNKENPSGAWYLRSAYMLNMTMDSSAEYVQACVDYWIYGNLRLQPGQYLRIQKSAPAGDPDNALLSTSSNAEKIPDLKQLGIELADANSEDIKKFVKDYIFGE